jgi:hypothetical protein
MGPLDHNLFSRLLLSQNELITIEEKQDAEAKLIPRRPKRVKPLFDARTELTDEELRVTFGAISPVVVWLPRSLDCSCTIP